MPHAHDLTLLGLGLHAYPLLVELAGAAWGRPPEELKVQVIHNLPASLDMLQDTIPDDWPGPHFVSLDQWVPGPGDGVRMPGVLREPAASLVWQVMSAATGLDVAQLGVIVHPTAEVAPSAFLGPGTWVQPGATIATMSRLGMCCHVNRMASVGHHNHWGSFSRINPGAHTAGSVVLGERVTVGMGALVREGVRVGDGAIIGAGSLVLKDVAEGHTVMGVPAKPRHVKNDQP